MNLKDFQEMIDFAVSAIERYTDKPPSIKLVISLSKHKGQTSVVLDIKEVGFDDKTATIFIEA